jgi:hypothetical protein
MANAHRQRRNEQLCQSTAVLEPDPKLRQMLLLNTAQAAAKSQNQANKEAERVARALRNHRQQQLREMRARRRELAQRWNQLHSGVQALLVAAEALELEHNERCAAPAFSMPPTAALIAIATANDGLARIELTRRSTQ